MEKEKILKEFKRLQEQIMFDIDNTNGKKKLINQYRLKSITFAIKSIEQYHKNIIDKTDLDKLIQIKGIGSGTIKRLTEILDTHTLSEIHLTQNNQSYLQLIDELESIYGIGRNTAYKLFKEHKIKSIDDFVDKVNSNKIHVNDNIKIGLKYINKLDTLIPRKDIDEFNEYILNQLLYIDPKLFGTICGSYRRLKNTSGDVDLIIVHTDYKSNNSQLNINYIDIVVKLLIKNNIIIDSLTKTDVKTKYMGIFKWNNSKPRRIDIRFIPYESYYYALLYFTGSKDFNKNMRSIAIMQDYTLNEYGLYNKQNKSIKVNSEKEIFDLLNMEYIPPDKR